MTQGPRALFALLAGVLVAVTPGHLQRGSTPPMPAVGAQYHGLWSDWTARDRVVVLDRLADAGATWVRVDVGWETLEPGGPGQVSDWYLDRLHDTVEAAGDRGLAVLATLWATPGWANGGRSRATPPDRAQDYARVAGWLAGELRGGVSAWEVWNEPNSDDFFTGDASAYVRLLRASYPAVKAADPGSDVVFGGPSRNDVAWLSQAYASGAQGSFDVLATHPYPAPADAGPEAITGLDDVRSLMEANGDGDLPVWFTELGWSSHGNDDATPSWARGVSETEQAYRLVEALSLVRTHYPFVSHVFWYAARDRTDTDAQNGNYGLLRSTLEPKPAYRALREALVHR